MSSLRGKSVIVTGGASGMGAASARQFVEAGAYVTIVDINQRLAEEVADDLGLKNPLIGDVGNSKFCSSVIEVAIATYERVDVLVNCAGTILRANAQKTSDAEWEKVMSTNVDGVFFMSRAVIGSMKKLGKGVIINFGSIWGSVGAAGVVA